MKREDCCCYLCCLIVNADSNPDCACDNIPVYDREQCMECPKRHFCDVTLQPWEYHPEGCDV